MAECTCPRVRVGREFGPKGLSEWCAVHGVGSEHWRTLPVMPYGFSGTRDMLRAEFLELRDKCSECSHSLILQHDRVGVCLECERTDGPCRGWEME
jgi:hypothetical protein